MYRMTASIVLALSLCPCAVSQHKDGHYLYLSMPDGAQQEGRSGAGILVFDIDNGHKFVRRIEIPIFNEGLRGFAGHLGNHAAYYSTTNHRVGAFDLETEQILWEKTYDQGADRSAVSADGAKLYVPTGWWYSGEDSGLLVLNARNGDLIKKIPVGPQAHNSIVGLRGDRLYLGTRTMLRARNKITYAECACRLGCRE